MANPVLIGWQTQITMSPAEAPPPLEQLKGWQTQITMSPAEAPPPLEQLKGWQVVIPPPLEQLKGWQVVIPPTFSDTFPLNGVVPGGGAQIIGSPIVQPVGRTSV